MSSIVLESKTIHFNNAKEAVEVLLQQSMVKFRELVLECEQQFMESEKYKVQYLTAKTKCDNKTCSGAEDLKKTIAAKDQIILSVASTLTKLNETKNFNILTDAFKILCEEVPLSTPPVEEKLELGSSSSTKIQRTNNICDKKDANVSLSEDIPNKEESLCEIDGTPGRTSPIIQSKRTRSILAKSLDFREKKKCPDDWPSPESKAVKLTYPISTRNKSGSGRLRQSRLNLVKLKQASVVDLTWSPEVLEQNNDQFVQALIKKESVENDDTIQPSPTSGSTNFTLLKTAPKASPIKFKKPPLSLKIKSENVSKTDENKDNLKNIIDSNMEESINILDQYSNRLKNGIIKDNKPEVKVEVEERPDFVDIDLTNCETLAGSPLLHRVEQIEREQRNKQCSPTKRPLMENINVVNTPPKTEAESSVSILRPQPNVKPTTAGAAAAVEKVKRKIADLVEPVYKEPIVRKKAEKRNLQGWSCEDCKNFFGELYKNDPVMLAKKINECSKHRGRHNPTRPKTPPNFWNPRWHVPTDTEELNRMNNADG